MLLGGLSPVAVSRGHSSLDERGPLSSLQCVGFSLQRLSPVAVSRGHSPLVMGGAAVFIVVRGLLTAAAFSSCGERGPLSTCDGRGHSPLVTGGATVFIAVRGLLSAAASLAVEHGL